MKYHVLPGDSLVEAFNQSKIDGKVIVFREAMIVGPVVAETPFEFWDQRARFILADYGDDEIVYHERVADEIEHMSDIGSDDEVSLWFEYELFCSVNMWFCLSMLAGSEAHVYRVEPSLLSEADRWKGFGQLGPDELQRCFDLRQRFRDTDVKLGAELWDAFRKEDHSRLLDLSDKGTPRFPYLSEVGVAAAERDTKPKEILSEIMAEGITDFEKIFPEFVRRAGVYGYGDAQVERMIDHLSS